MLLIDTAGRLHTKVNLMAELDKVQRVVRRQLPGAPHEVLMTVDATTGQNGLRQAQMFKEVAGLTGIILDQARRDRQGRHRARHSQRGRGADQAHLGRGEGRGPPPVRRPRVRRSIVWRFVDVRYFRREAQQGPRRGPRQRQPHGGPGKEGYARDTAGPPRGRRELRVVKEFVSNVRERATGAEVSKALSPGPAGRQDSGRGAREPDGRHGPQALVCVQTANGRDARRPQRPRQDDDGREAGFVRSQARQESLSRRLRHVQAGRDRPAAADRAGALGACVHRGHGAEARGDRRARDQGGQGRRATTSLSWTRRAVRSSTWR